MDYVEGYQDQANVVAPPSVVTWRTRRPDIFGPLSAFGRQPYPLGVEGVAKLPNLTAGLFARGYSRADVAAIMSPIQPPQALRACAGKFPWPPQA